MYHDPNAQPGEPKWDELIAAIKREKRVVLTDDKVLNDGKGFERTNYIALFAVDGVEVDGSNLRFRFVERLAELVRR